MRMRLLLILIATSLLAGVSSIATADIVNLKKGQKYEGTIVAEEEKRIQLKLESGVRIWFQKDQIDSMEKTETKKTEQEPQDTDPPANTEGLTDDVTRARELLKKLREQPDALSGKPAAPPAAEIASEPEPDPAIAANQEEIEKLIEVLQKGQYYDRLSACKKLGNLGAKEAIPHLIHYLDDEKFSIRDESNTSLKKITGQDFGFNSHDRRNVRLWAIDRWKQWYEAEKKKEGKTGLKSLW